MNPGRRLLRSWWLAIALLLSSNNIIYTLGTLVVFAVVALLIWRFSTYYLSILAGAALTVAENLGALRKRRTQEKREGVSNE